MVTNQQRGNLIIITAASGAGKTSLVKALLAKDRQVKLSVSHTTRKPRSGEQDSVHYHFVNEAEFLQILNAGGFLESADVHGAVIVIAFSTCWHEQSPANLAVPHRNYR